MATGYNALVVLESDPAPPLVIDTNLPPILHRFRDIGFDTSKIAILATPVVFNSPDWGDGAISVSVFVDVNGWPTYLML